MEININKKFHLTKLTEYKLKYRIPILKDKIDLLIYFYPKGTKQSCKSYMASNCKFDFLKKFETKDMKQSFLNIMWKCGDKEKGHSMYIEYSQIKNKKFGFESLFKIDLMTKNNWYLNVLLKIKQTSPIHQTIVHFVQLRFSINIIKKAISIHMNSNKNNSFYSNSITIKSVKQIIDSLQSQQQNEINLIKKKRELRQQSLFRWISTDKNESMNKNINTNVARPYKKYLTIKDEYSISEMQMMHGIKIITDRLGSKDMFNYIPNIDCFSSNINYQRKCKWHITKDMDYFSIQYNETNYWIDKIAWCFTPYIRKIIVDTINSFRKRKIRGFVFAPYEKNQSWIGQTQRICEAYCIIPKKKKDIFETETEWFCYFDSILFYFNYQK